MGLDFSQGSITQVVLKFNPPQMTILLNFSTSKVTVKMLPEEITRFTYIYVRMGGAHQDAKRY